MDNHFQEVKLCGMKSVILAFILLVPCDSQKIYEAFKGETIKLHCLSCDDHHVFQFWQLPHEILGPGIEFSRMKYKYEILTGTLYINKISSNEHGIYSCYCKNIADGTFRAESIELLVKEHWDPAYEEDSVANVYRVVIIISVSIIVACILCILYHLRSNRHIGELGDSQDGLEDERFLPEAMEMTAHLDTEFPREFTTTAQIN